MLTGLWSNPRQWAVLPIAALTEKACLSTPPPLPPLLSTTATPQSTRCIVKKWEGTLEPSCSMKVGCSVCLLMRWKEDGSEKWNKVKEHIQKTERSFVGGERGSCRHFFPPASFEVQVRKFVLFFKKSRERDGSPQQRRAYYFRQKLELFPRTIADFLEAVNPTSVYF